jgi:hypothetical protein
MTTRRVSILIGAVLLAAGTGFSTGPAAGFRPKPFRRPAVSRYGIGQSASANR